MKILFDLIATQPVNNTMNHGGAEYTKVIFHKLIEKSLLENEIIIVDAVYNEKEKLDKEIHELIIKNKIKLIHVNSKKDIESLLIKYNYEKFFSGLGYSLRNITIPSSTKFLPVVHGLRPLEMPTDKFEYHFTNNLKEKLIWIIKNLAPNLYLKYRKKDYYDFLSKYIDNLIVVSNHTKYSIESFYPKLSLKETKVFYSPEKISVKSTYSEKKNFILMVSASVWIKNSYRGIIALDNFFDRKEYKEYKAIILGGLPNKIKNKIKNKNNFEIKGYVSAEELENYYAEAKFLFYPSLNEGFGYPPLEAMKYSTPVIASSISAIPEICSDSAIYFSPYSSEEMTARLIQAFSSDYKSLQERSLSRYKEINNKQKEDLNQIVQYIVQ